MNLREVTIGRDKNSDIYLPPNYTFASSKHAVIFFSNNQLMYKDTSTNGTIINNTTVRQRILPINRGDVILIAGKYPLTWNQIDSFFPNISQNHNNISPNNKSDKVSSTPCIPEKLNLGKWSWGAFYFNWIWGMLNGCWWMLLINIAAGLLCGIIGVISLKGAIYSLIIFIIIPIIYGIKGTQWAWEYGKIKNVHDFEITQSVWNKLGLFLFILQMVIILLYVLIFFTSIYSTLSLL